MQFCNCLLKVHSRSTLLHFKIATMKFSRLFLLCLWILCRYSIEKSDAFQCQSCFLGCENFDDCDCEGEATCDGPYCYAKLEHFTDGGISAIQKGCTNEVSNSFLGCQYASDDRSIACFCSGHLCNNAANLSLYQAPKLPLITCCECNDDETGDELCFPHNCTRNCTGNYCYLDLVANAQGCGWGHPQLFHFLRSRKYRRWSNELTCAEYYDNYRNYMSGCTCSNDFCNVVDDVERLKVGQHVQPQEQTHFCYSLYAQSETAFKQDIYRQASLCRSRFCFVSWTSVEIVFDPPEDEYDEPIIDFAEIGSGESDYYRGKRPRVDYGLKRRDSLPALRSAFEISAGCLSVDDVEKVRVGCTVEWSQRERSPLTKHCVCAEKLCNDFHLIDDTFFWSPSSTASTATSSEEQNPPIVDQRQLPSDKEVILTTTASTERMSVPIGKNRLYDKFVIESTTPSTAARPDAKSEASPTSILSEKIDESFVPVTSVFATSPTTEAITEFERNPTTQSAPNSTASDNEADTATASQTHQPRQLVTIARPSLTNSGEQIFCIVKVIVYFCVLSSIVCTAAYAP